MEFNLTNKISTSETTTVIVLSLLKLALSLCATHHTSHSAVVAALQKPQYCKAQPSDQREKKKSKKNPKPKTPKKEKTKKKNPIFISIRIIKIQTFYYPLNPPLYHQRIWFDLLPKNKKPLSRSHSHSLPFSLPKKSESRNKQKK